MLNEKIELKKVVTYFAIAIVIVMSLSLLSFKYILSIS